MDLINSLPQRKRIRLKDYDYSQNGYYFVTICTHDKKHILGNINTNDLQDVGQGLCPCRLSDIGSIVQEELNQIPNRFNTVLIDGYVIMPNHIHAIIVLNKDNESNEKQKRQGQSPCPTTNLVSLFDVIGAFKSITTKRANQHDGVSERKIWQYRYHDNIIRNKNDYQLILNYIQQNPTKWIQDRYYVKY